MKEATGELNMTVVTVVAIAAVAAFFYAFVWPGIRKSIEQSTYCNMANCSSDWKTCTAEKDDGTTWTGSCESYFKKQQETTNGNGGTTPS